MNKAAKLNVDYKKPETALPFAILRSKVNHREKI